LKNLHPMNTTSLQGIDVSHHNGLIDWKKIAASTPPISFAYIKVSQGLGFTDPQCTRNATAAAQAKIPFGFYHFAALDSKDVIHDAVSEAKWFQSTMSVLPAPKLIPALDLEVNTAQLKPAEVQLWISTFFSAMHNLGYPRVMLYSYQPFLDLNLPASHPFGTVSLWLAQYIQSPTPKLPQGWKQFSLWQYTDKGKVLGINQACDMSRTSPNLLKQIKT
jgi:lysozyme